MINSSSAEIMEDERIRPEKIVDIDGQSSIIQSTNLMAINEVCQHAQQSSQDHDFLAAVPQHRIPQQSEITVSKVSYPLSVWNGDRKCFHHHHHHPCGGELRDQGPIFANTDKFSFSHHSASSSRSSSSSRRSDDIGDGYNQPRTRRKFVCYKCEHDLRDLGIKSRSSKRETTFFIISAFIFVVVCLIISIMLWWTSSMFFSEANFNRFSQSSRQIFSSISRDVQFLKSLNSDKAASLVIGNSSKFFSITPAESSTIDNLLQQQNPLVNYFTFLPHTGSSESGDHVIFGQNSHMTGLDLMAASNITGSKNFLILALETQSTFAISLGSSSDSLLLLTPIFFSSPFNNSLSLTTNPEYNITDSIFGFVASAINVDQLLNGFSSNGIKISLLASPSVSSSSSKYFISYSLNAFLKGDTYWTLEISASSVSALLE